MVKLYANAQLIQDYKIALDDGRAHSLIVDLASDNSEGFGPTSLELCVMSHTGCYATIFALTAAKMRIPLKGLEVKVEADAPEDRIKRCHELTLNCPVGKIFEKAGIKIAYNLKRMDKNE